MQLSFVYPVYNEIENLPRLYQETAKIAAGLADDFELVLVDDGSTDGSREYLEEMATRYDNVIVLHHERNRGLGAAIRTGLVNATKELVLYMDSDFPVAAEDAHAVIAQFDDKTDLLIGYRLGRAEGLHREVMSWTYNRMIRRTFGLHVTDVNFAFKLIRRSLLEQMRLRSEGSFIDAELLLEAARLGARMKEVGIYYHRRTAGVSTASSSRAVVKIFGEMGCYWQRWRWNRLGPARLIINADDFGLCPEVNRGVIAAFEQGIVTSTSLLTTGEAFSEAVEYARTHPALDLGIHLALTGVQPALAPAHIPTLTQGNGRLPPDWRTFLSQYLLKRIRPAEIEAELRSQLERARNTGLTFSHMDSHQHLHLLPGIAAIVARLAEQFGFSAMRLPNQRSSTAGIPRPFHETIALKLAVAAARKTFEQGGFTLADNFLGFYEAGRWSEQDLLESIHTLEFGLTELCCHPGADKSIDQSLGWGYNWEQELRALTNPVLQQAISHSGVTLTTYREECTRQQGN